ncbi:MAG: DUF5916 domain-containing protein [Candidatus Aminicenantes bacterium]|nr:DUF5916 domain-containing protein [Candidatus Aminicenantes bacterium]
MINKRGILFFMSVFLFIANGFVGALELQQDGKIILPDRSTETIKIDGDLNENIWTNPPLAEDFHTYLPVYGEKLNQATLVWMAYDHRNLYFAFKCWDNEPDKIKTSIAQRDKMFRDDWVAVLLDAMGNNQTSYEFYVNPNGIQGDNLNSAVTGTDNAPDFVWESAGKVTKEGYQVEIRIPLESIRFKSGREVKMGLLLLRNISRLGVGATWPQTQPGQTDFNFMATLVYKDLAYRLKLELLPNFTYSRDVERESKDTWGDPVVSKNFGASLKYGITSSITAEATVNPDFSQVESDAFQVEVNQRYPIFYSEKRPFFMEGMDVFDFGIINQGMMIDSVDTRQIGEPGWAAKLSGSLGKMNFALLTTNDKTPGQDWDGGVNPNPGKKATWAIFRGKYNLGSDNALGVLYSGRYFAGTRNNAFGVDFQFRFLENARINAAYLYTGTQESAGAPVKNGSGFNTVLQYLVPKLTVWATYERYDKNFNMASAFMNRIDISRGQVYIGPNFYLKIKGADWFRRIQPYVQYVKAHDLGSHMDDTAWKLGADMYFTRSGFLRIEFRNEKEAWQGQLFDQKYLFSLGTVQLTNWLTISGNYRYGDQIYYDLEEPFLGAGHQIGFGFTFQPSIKLTLGFNMVHGELSRKADDKKLYTVDIYNAQTTYQFNKYFFIRAAVRYDNYRDKLLTDLLASFTFIPGTVVHLGYGSLYENKEWQIDRWVPGQGHLINMKNGLFFKISYLWQIK